MSASMFQTPQAKGKCASPGSEPAPKRARLPAPHRTGDPDEDGRAESNMRLLQEVVDSCLADTSQIQALHNEWAKRRPKRAFAAATGTVASDTFADVTTLSTLWKNHRDFCLWLLTEVSDLTLTELDAASKKPNVEETGLYLLVHWLQVDEKFALSDKLRVRAVFTKWSKTRGALVGNRLAKFKANGGLVNGKIIWNFACYRVTAKDAVLDKVTHLPSTAAPVTVSTAQYKLPTTYKLQMNWSDKRGCLEMDGCPPIPLARYFQNKTGPKSYDTPAAKSKESAATVDVAYEAWVKERQAAMVGVADKGIAEANTLCVQTNQEKTREIMKKARESAKQNNRKKKDDTAIAIA